MDDLDQSADAIPCAEVTDLTLSFLRANDESRPPTRASGPGAGPAGTLLPLTFDYRQLPCLWWRAPGRRALLYLDNHAGALGGGGMALQIARSRRTQR